MSRIRLHKINLTPNNVEAFAVSGNYIRIRKANNPLLIITDLNDSFEISEGEDLILGDINFKRLEVLTLGGVQEVVELFVGQDVKISAARVAGTVMVSGTVKTQDAGTPYTNTYKGMSILGAGAVDAVFLPAANVNGIILNSMQFINNIGAAGGENGGYYAGSIAPANASAGGCLLSMTELLYLNGTFHSKAENYNAIELPAGYGLWYVSTVAMNWSIRTVVYTVK